MGVLVLVGVIEIVGVFVGVIDTVGEGVGRTGDVGSNPFLPLITRESLACTLNIGGIRIIYY